MTATIERRANVTPSAVVPTDRRFDPIITGLAPAAWRRQQKADGHPVELDDPIFTNPAGRPLHPETISQLFTRQVTRTAMAPIRFHDLRHTHATLLIAAGVPIKVV